MLMRAQKVGTEKSEFVEMISLALAGGIKGASCKTGKMTKNKVFFVGEATIVTCRGKRYEVEVTEDGDALLFREIKKDQVGVSINLN